MCLFIFYYETGGVGYPSAEILLSIRRGRRSWRRDEGKEGGEEEAKEGMEDEEEGKEKEKD